MERRYNQTHIRSEGNKISGYASVFFDGTPETEFKMWKDGPVERMSKTAFNRAIDERHDVRALYNHNPDNLLGRTSAGTLHITTDAKGLRYSIPFDANDADHVRVKSKLDRGDLTGSSFAFQITGDEWSKEDGKEVRTITDVSLVDVGPVTYPAYEGATASTRDAATLQSYDNWKAKQETQKRIEKLNNLPI